MTSILITAIAIAITPFLPHQLDKDGWGLRRHNLSDRGPYFAARGVVGCSEQPASHSRAGA